MAVSTGDERAGTLQQYIINERWRCSDRDLCIKNISVITLDVIVSILLYVQHWAEDTLEYKSEYFKINAKCIALLVQSTGTSFKYYYLLHH